MPFALWSQPCVNLFALRPQGHIREGVLRVLHGAQQWPEDIPKK